MVPIGGVVVEPSAAVTGVDPLRVVIETVGVPSAPEYTQADGVRRAAPVYSTTPAVVLSAAPQPRNSRLGGRKSSTTKFEVGAVLLLVSVRVNGVAWE